MRKLYLFLVATVLLVIVLIAFAFFFFEKEKHQIFLYKVEIAGEASGYIEIDRYKTENKIIYKSMSFRPRGLNSEITHEKLAFDRKSFKLEKFDRECKNFGALTEALHIKANNDGVLDFLARTGSRFSYLSNVAHAKDVSVFNEESMVTYVSFVDRYNFAMGGAQSFNALYRHSLELLPPAKAKIIFTSIRDEYIDTLGKKTKTECLVVRAKGIPEARIWVSKKDRGIVKMEIKSKALLIKKIALLPEVTVEDYKPYLAGDTISSNIIFPSGNIALAGTIAIPQRGGKLPAVLLVGGEGPYNRESAGLYTDISRELAKSGYVTLSFDKRGIGESQGNNTDTSVASEIQDIESALWFLANHERVDKDKIFVAAYGSTCSYLPQLDFSKFPVKGLIMLGITKAPPLLDFESARVLDKINALTEIDEKYPETLELLKKETLAIVKNTEKDYAFVGGRRVFLKRMRELSLLKPLESFERLNIPLITLYGKEDTFGSLTYIKSIKKALREATPTRPFQVVGLRGLGLKHYKVNKEVLKTIRDWVDKHLIL